MPTKVRIVTRSDLTAGERIAQVSHAMAELWRWHPG